MNTERRIAARGLLLAPTGRTLLLHTQLGKRKSVWMVPGGGVETGETHLQAVVREVAEETGLRGAIVGPELWWRHVTIRFPDRTVQMTEHFFLVKVEEFEPSFDGLEDYEVAELLGHRWWGASELLEAGDLIAPPELGSLLGELVEFGPRPTREIETRVHGLSEAAQAST